MKKDSFEHFDVWKKAHQVVLDTYTLTKGLPTEEKYGLTSQMRRAAVSVPANLVEGYGRVSRRDKLRFYDMSQGSARELSYFLILARDLGYLKTTEELSRLVEDVSMMLHRLMQSIRDSLK